MNTAPTLIHIVVHAEILKLGQLVFVLVAWVGAQASFEVSSQGWRLVHMVRVGLGLSNRTEYFNQSISL